MPTDQSRAGLEVSEGRGDSIKGLGVCKCHIINQAKGKVTTALPITQHGERIVSFFRLSRLLVWAALFFFFAFAILDVGPRPMRRMAEILTLWQWPPGKPGVRYGQPGYSAGC